MLTEEHNIHSNVLCPELRPSSLCRMLKTACIYLKGPVDNIEEHRSWGWGILEAPPWASAQPKSARPVRASVKHCNSEVLPKSQDPGLFSNPEITSGLVADILSFESRTKLAVPHLSQAWSKMWGSRWNRFAISFR